MLQKGDIKKNEFWKKKKTSQNFVNFFWKRAIVIFASLTDILLKYLHVLLKIKILIKIHSHFANFDQ